MHPQDVEIEVTRIGLDPAFRTTKFALTSSPDSNGLATRSAIGGSIRSAELRSLDGARAKRARRRRRPSSPAIRMRGHAIAPIGRWDARPSSSVGSACSPRRGFRLGSCYRPSNIHHSIQARAIRRRAIIKAMTMTISVALIQTKEI